jgi:hypothetical protein
MPHAVLLLEFYVNVAADMHGSYHLASMSCVYYYNIKFLLPLLLLSFFSLRCIMCSYRLASIRCVPQLPAGSVDFTTFTWPALLRRLKAMGVSGQLPAWSCCCCWLPASVTCSALLTVCSDSTSRGDNVSDSQKGLSLQLLYLL